MATSRAGERVTTLHQASQRALGQTSSGLLRQLWYLFVLEHELTEDEWIRAVLQLLGSRQRMSAHLARTYYRTFRAVELGSFEPLRLFDVRPFNEQSTRVRIQSLLDQFHQMNGTTTPQFDDTVVNDLVQVVVDGGRLQVIEDVQTDGEAHGWYRVDDGSPCAFCALLISRGNVYKSEQAARFRSHPRCGCTAEPSFTSERFRNNQAEELNDLYKKVTKGQSDPLNAFRRHYERPNVDRTNRKKK